MMTYRQKSKNQCRWSSRDDQPTCNQQTASHAGAVIAQNTLVTIIAAKAWQRAVMDVRRAAHDGAFLARFFGPGSYFAIDAERGQRGLTGQVHTKINVPDESH